MPSTAALGLRRMLPRDPRQPHRVASTLELFFDLTFVVAVSVAAEELAHVEPGELGSGVVRYALVFFAIWWAWVNFTWFASAFDPDDWLYRVLTITQMGGVLVLAAGVQRGFEAEDFRLMVTGYVIMRVAMIAQWLRAARNRGYRGVAMRYAAGIGAAQVLWLLWLGVPRPLALIGFAVLALLEVAIPAWAERAHSTPFHLHHVGERYGLFTLIVLGEGLLAVTNTLIGAQHEVERASELVVLGVTALVLIAGMWWIYFAREPHVGMTSVRSTFTFGYLHLLVFASAAALASGLELGLRASEGRLELPAAAVRAASTVPVAVFLLATWSVVLRFSVRPATNRLLPLAAVLIAGAAVLPAGVQVAAVLVVGVVVLLEVDSRRHSSEGPDARRASAARSAADVPSPHTDRGGQG